MERGTQTVAERRAVLDVAREALAELGDVLHQVSGEELAELLGELDAVCAGAGAARAAVVAEAVRRGEVTPGDAHGWVREHAPSLRQGGAGHVAAVAVRVSTSGSGLVAPDAVPEPGGAVPLVWSAVETGALSASTAVAVWREVERLAPLLQPDAVPTVTEALVDLAERWGPGTMRRLRPRLLAEYGHHGALDRMHDRLAAAARLSSPHVESADLTEYQLWMTPEQAATLEAAIGPLAAPAPNPDTGERDTRPAGRRRVEALTEVCRLSSAAAADAAGTDGVATAGAVLHVSVELTDLEARTGAGEVLGSVADGALVPPEALRRIACDAALVPYVLGVAGEVLDVGRVLRLFNRAQRRMLWRRDRGCTYPGCTAPATWARAHHVRHWADGGATDGANAALLCQRHHTVVHQRRLWATVREKPDEHGRFVVWDLTEGSYDREAERWKAEQAGGALGGCTDAGSSRSAGVAGPAGPVGPTQPDPGRLRALVLEAAGVPAEEPGEQGRDLDDWWDAVAALEEPWDDAAA